MLISQYANEYKFENEIQCADMLLRKHLKADPRLLLETIHGLGYRLSVPAN